MATMDKSYFQRVVDGSKMFFAGGTAGAIARTASAPLDRIKLLFQVQAMASSGVQQGSGYLNIGQAAMKIYKDEGILAFWKGNGTNIIRIFPYAAAQLAANDGYKRVFANENGDLTVARRLASGACAGMTATALTHPLDTIRLRLALPNHPYKGTFHAMSTVARAEGPIALYKGLAPTLVGIAPYAALNFASYDLLKHWVYGEHKKQSAITNLFIGATAGTTAASVCYPLDTVRRRMQMKGSEQMYKNQWDALKTIWATEGMRGFYNGWAANTLKVVPQSAIRFVAYEFFKSALGIKKAKTDT